MAGAAVGGGISDDVATGLDGHWREVDHGNGADSVFVGGDGGAALALAFDEGDVEERAVVNAFADGMLGDAKPVRDCWLRRIRS